MTKTTNQTPKLKLEYLTPNERRASEGLGMRLEYLTEAEIFGWDS